MKLEFKSAGDLSTVVEFSIGDTFERSSKGVIIAEAEGSVLEVGFPNNIYLSIAHG